jgi:hypothetical protein
MAWPDTEPFRECLNALVIKRTIVYQSNSPLNRGL